MSNSAGGGSYEPDAYERALADFQRVLSDVEVVGWPKRDAELAELERLVAKYPTEARKLLADE